eukprot:sb/3472314/
MLCHIGRPRCSPRHCPLTLFAFSCVVGGTVPAANMSRQIDSGHMMLDIRHNCYKANSTSRRSYWVPRTTKKMFAIWWMKKLGFQATPFYYLFSLRLKNAKNTLRGGVEKKPRALECLGIAIFGHMAIATWNGLSTFHWCYFVQKKIQSKMAIAIWPKMAMPRPNYPII